MTAVLSAVTTEGGLLHPELLERIVRQDPKLRGLTPDDFHVDMRLGEASSRAWTALQTAWRAFRFKLDRVPKDEPATAITRDAWLLPLFRELGWGTLAPGGERFRTEAGPVAISHGWDHVPIHCVGARVSIDKRSLAGDKQVGPRTSPHGLVQDLLNRSDDHLWAIVSNGLVLRLLRDHQSLSSAAYVELDLERIFDGGLYGEFQLLFALCHQSRFEAPVPEDIWLERWFKIGQEEGVRALDRLRAGVEQALTELGAGFLRHAENGPLREALKDGSLAKEDYFRELLRLIYRILFLFVAEDRDALFADGTPDDIRERYRRFYSTEHLRALASRTHGGAHADLWTQLRLVLRSLWQGESALGLPALGSGLFDPGELPHLSDAALANRHLLAAIRALSELTEGGRTLRVSYRNLGAQELGSVYEGLLELHPSMNVDAGTFELASAAGHERKTTGSYYTPASLVDCLLDTALDPVVDAATLGKTQADAEAALLALRIVDPACGSGHFLVAAARRLAERLARIRHPDEEPTPHDRRTAKRDVVGRCLFGVDLNPMAVELCKVSLWIEALEPGRPLSFLDGHIQFGNALVGATPAFLARGIPEAAFEPLAGDDKKVASALKKQNKTERSEIAIDFSAPPPSTYVRLGEVARLVDAASDASLADVRQKEAQYDALVGSNAFDSARFLGDLWCAAFVWRKDPSERGEVSPLRDLCPTEAAYRRLVEEPTGATPALREEVKRLREQYGFFHWHLAFPQVLRPKRVVGEHDPCGWEGGFDVVLGNPPWEKVKLVEKEFFADKVPDIAQAPTASARTKLIRAIRDADEKSPYFAIARAFEAASRHAGGTSHLLRKSGRFPLCGKGDVNTYAVFAELDRALMSEAGRAGFIVPSGIATDDTTKEFFRSVVATSSLASMYGFENEGKLFAGIDHRVNFCLMVLSGLPVPSAEFSAFVREPSVLRERGRTYSLSGADIGSLNPNTGTCPVFRTRRDADISLVVYRRTGVLWREVDPVSNPWGIRFLAMLHMANDSSLFGTRAALAANDHQLEGNVFLLPGSAHPKVPLFEAKMVHHFNHRFGDFALLAHGQREHILPQVQPAELSDAGYLTMPRYWVDEREVLARLDGIWSRGWLLGWRDVTDSRSSARTVVACVIPRAAVGDKFLLMLPSAEPAAVAALYANLCSFALDYFGRQKVGGVSLKYFTMRQLPVLTPVTLASGIPWAAEIPALRWLLPRTIELTYTAWDLAPFARDCGYGGPPFRWDPERRALLRAELDAAFFHLYGLPRDDVDYVMETFPIVKRHDEAAHGHFRTKRLILERYDAMAEAAAKGTTYQTVLDPPPADPRIAHPPRAPT